MAHRWAGPRWVEGIKAMAGWVASGKIKVDSTVSISKLTTVLMNHNVVLKVRETVVEGFDKMPQALMGLFTGDNTGKMVVKA